MLLMFHKYRVNIGGDVILNKNKYWRPTSNNPTFKIKAADSNFWLILRIMSFVYIAREL